MKYIQKHKEVKFPSYTGVKVKMMPIRFGDETSLPPELKGYLPLIEACDLRFDSICYLTVHESEVTEGVSQRHNDIHIDSFHHHHVFDVKAVWLASTDGTTRLWDTSISPSLVYGENFDTSILSSADELFMEPNILYSMTNHTPHQALPSRHTGTRQFFRLVSEDIGRWFSDKNTPNPLGILPGVESILTP